MRAFVTLVAAANPAAVALALWPRDRLRTLLPAAAVAAVVAVVAAALSGPLLDALDVSRPTFQVAAAIVVGVAGVRWLVAGAPRVAGEGPPTGWGRVLLPVLFPVLVTPQLVTASVSVGADHGVGLAAAGAVTGLALATGAAALAKQRAPLWDVGTRLVGATAIALALALAVDGVKTI